MEENISSRTVLVGKVRPRPIARKRRFFVDRLRLCVPIEGGAVLLEGSGSSDALLFG